MQFNNPSTMHTPKGYSHVVDTRGGRTIYISGQVSIDPAGNFVGLNDLDAQAVRIFENLKLALASVGASFDHVVKLTYYYLDISQIQVVREVRDRYINTSHPPASAALEVPRLYREECLLEIEAIAVIPD